MDVEGMGLHDVIHSETVQQTVDYLLTQDDP